MRDFVINTGRDNAQRNIRKAEREARQDQNQIARQAKRGFKPARPVNPKHARQFKRFGGKARYDAYQFERDQIRDTYSGQQENKLVGLLRKIFGVVPRA